MIKYRKQTTLNQLIKQQNISKGAIAKSMHISPQWLSTLLQKDIKDLTINQLDEIIKTIGLTLSINVEDKLS